MINKVNESYKRNWISLTLGPLIKLIEAIFDLLIPLFMKAVIDLNQYHDVELIENKLTYNLAKIIRLFPSFNENQSLSDALIGGIIILVMGILGFLVTMLAQYIAARTAVKVGVEVRDSLFNKIIHLSKRQKDNLGTNKLQTTLNSDTYQIQQGVLIFIRLIARAPFIIIGSLIISFILDWRIGLAFTSIVPLILLVIFLTLNKAEKNYVGIQQNLDDISKINSDTIEGARVIRAFKSENREEDKFKKSSAKYYKSSVKVNRINALINPLTFAITSIVLIVILFILKPILIDGDDAQKVVIASTMIAEMAYLSQIFFTTVQLTSVLLDLTKAGVSRKRIDEILTLKEEIINGDETINEGKSSIFLKYNHVYFSYVTNAETYVLKDIDFEINEGETLGIIGGTGTGKSTIINLLERFYDVSKGEIIYKDKDIKSYDISSLRNEFGLVNQKATLFKGSIRSNFLMSKIDASEEEMVEALKKAQAYDFVFEKGGLDIDVKEGGVNFSGGQRQRLSIARTLIRNPKLLILDDSTSALDLLTEKKIRNELKKMENMSKIIISQRVSIVSDADLILVLDQGQIVGKGKHDDLLKSCSIYKEIFESQIRKGEHE